MALRKGLPAKLAATDADDTRYDLSGLIVCNTDGTPRGGVLSPVGVNLVTATATMNVSVVRFQGAAIRDAGVVLLANDGPTNVLHEDAPAANSRIDVVWGKQNDASSTVSVPDVNNLSAFGITKGAALAVPVKPAIPAGTVELATVQIPSTATATNSPGVVITQTAQFTAAAGGVVPFRTKEEMGLWTTAPPQQRACALATGVDYRFNGTSWRLASRSVIGEYKKGTAPGFVLLTAYSDTTPAVTVTAVTNGGKVEIEYDASVQYAGVGINNMIIYYKVLCDGVVVGDESTQHLPPINAGSVCRLADSHTPAAGSHTWKIQVASSSVSAAVLGKARLVIIENP